MKKNSIFKNTANQTLVSSKGFTRAVARSKKGSKIRNSFIKNVQKTRTLTNSTDSAMNEYSEYILHPQIISNLKVDKGSIENFMKKDDLQEMIDFNDDFDSNFIISKIDKIGLVGRKARMDMKKKEISKKRW